MCQYLTQFNGPDMRLASNDAIFALLKVNAVIVEMEGSTPELTLMGMMHEFLHVIPFLLR